MPREHDHPGLLLHDEEGEGMVGGELDEVRRWTAPANRMHDDCGRLSSCLVHLDHRLVRDLGQERRPPFTAGDVIPLAHAAEVGGLPRERQRETQPDEVALEVSPAEGDLELGQLDDDRLLLHLRQDTPATR